jgi:hypothetical protein
MKKFFLLCPVGTGHHQEVKYSSTLEDVKKKLTPPPRRTGRKGSAFCRQTSLQKEDLSICALFLRISALTFFPADSRGKGPQIFRHLKVNRGIIFFVHLCSTPYGLEFIRLTFFASCPPRRTRKKITRAKTPRRKGSAFCRETSLQKEDLFFFYPNDLSDYKKN